MTQDKNTPTSLSTMLGSGVPFEAKGKTYTVLPIMVAHIEQFQKSQLFMAEGQIFNFLMQKIDKPSINGLVVNLLLPK